MQRAPNAAPDIQSLLRFPQAINLMARDLRRTQGNPAHTYPAPRALSGQAAFLYARTPRKSPGSQNNLFSIPLLNRLKRLGCAHLHKIWHICQRFCQSWLRRLHQSGERLADGRIYKAAAPAAGYALLQCAEGRQLEAEGFYRPGFTGRLAAGAFACSASAHGLKLSTSSRRTMRSSGCAL